MTQGKILLWAFCLSPPPVSARVVGAAAPFRPADTCPPRAGCDPGHSGAAFGAPSSCKRASGSADAQRVVASAHGAWRAASSFRVGSRWPRGREAVRGRFSCHGALTSLSPRDPTGHPQLAASVMASGWP